MALPPFRGKEGVRIANRRLTPPPRPEESRSRQYVAFSTHPSGQPSRHFRRDVLVHAEERSRRLGPFPSRPEAGSLRAGRTLLQRGRFRARAARSPAAARRCRRPRRQTRPGQKQALVEWAASPPVVTAVQVGKRPRPAVPRTVWTPARQRATQRLR